MRSRTVDKDGKPVITERMLQELVRKAALLNGWLYYHTWNSFRSPAGFPDCVLCRNGRLLFVELKSAKGKLTQEQEKWIGALNKVGRVVEVYVVKPDDFDAFYEKLK